MNKIIKFLMCFLIFTGFISIYAEDVNIIMKDGKVIQAELLGKTDEKIFIKDTEGNAKEIMLKNIKHVFNSKTGEKIEFDVKEKGTSTTTESKSTTKIQNNKVMYKIPEQEKYVVLDKGTLKPKVDIFKRTGKLTYLDFDMFYLEWYPFLGNSITSDFGSIQQGELFDGVLGIRAIGTGIAYFLRPFDFIAIAPYYRVEWWFSAAVTDKGYTIDLPQSSAGFCTKLIFYSELMKGYENDIYLMVQTGFRSLGNWIDDAQILTPDNSEVDLSSFTFDLGFFLGIAVDLLDLKIGYRFCKYTDITIINESKLPSSSFPLEIDMSGIFASLGVKIEI
jgi:hypothetical protein